jgi:DNA repair protein RadC
MEQLELFNWKKPRPKKHPQEWKLVSVRECPLPEDLRHCDEPQKAAVYWRLHVEAHPFFDPHRECFVVIILNTKLRARGHHFVAVGTLNECLAHPRDVFRVAIVSAAYAIVLMHNHPSGEPEPSGADITITRRLNDAGAILGIQVIDHVIVGHQRHCSLKEMGLF